MAQSSFHLQITWNCRESRMQRSAESTEVNGKIPSLLQQNGPSDVFMMLWFGNNNQCIIRHCAFSPVAKFYKGLNKLLP